MLFRNVYIGLGSNLGDREAILQEAIGELEAELVNIKSLKSLTSSYLYETEAWGMSEGTPAFLNQVLCVETDLELEQLLEILMKVEKTLGRIRSENKEEGVYHDRPIDLDILVAGNEVVDSMTLTVPHPRIGSRRFVLQPLFDLEPNLLIPGTNSSVEQLLENCPQLPEVKRL